MESSGVVVSSGSINVVSKGQVASGTIVLNGGLQEVLSGGDAKATMISSGGIETDYGTTSGTTVSSGGKETVFSGGRAGHVTVNSGGTLEVTSGGHANSTTVNGGLLFVDAGGIVLDTTLSGGSETVYGRGISYKTTIVGGQETVDSGGVANGTAILTAGILEVSGGTINNSVISSGIIYVQSGGVENNTRIVGDSTSEVIESGGVSNSSTIAPEGPNTHNFAYQIDYGTTHDTIVDNGGTQYVQSTEYYVGSTLYTVAGVARGTVVNSGGMLIVDGGTAFDSIINSGGAEYTEQSEDGPGIGTAKNVTIAGGLLSTASGGSLSGTVKFSGSGGELALGSNLSGSNFVISGFSPGNKIEIDQAYSAGDTATITKTGLVTISAGGTTYKLNIAGATVGVTGFQVSSASDKSLLLTEYYDEDIVVSSGVTVSGLTSNDFRAITVLDGGVTSAIFLTSGEEIVDSGGVANGTYLSAGTLEVSGGTINDTVDSGGALFVQSGGIENHTSLIGNSTGELIVSGGISNSSTIDPSGSGAFAYQADEGNANGTIVDYGGIQYVEAAYYTNSEGQQYIDMGIASSTVVNSGGMLIVDGGEEFDSVVNSGGAEYTRPSNLDSLFYNGITTNVTIAGGLLSTAAGGTLSGTVIFSGRGGELVIDGNLSTSFVISGFSLGNTIEIDGEAAYSATDKATVTAPGVVTVAVGSKTINLNIAGATVGQTSFQVTSAADGGLLLTMGYPNNIIVSSGVTSVGITRSAGQSITVLSGGTTSAVVLSGGTETVSAGGLSIATSGGGETVLSGGVASGNILFDGTLNISSGGVSVSATVVSGNGFEQVYSGGVASDTIVKGNLFVNGGTIINATLSSGDITLFSGTAISTVIDSGAAQYGTSASTASGTIINRGGIEYGGAVEQDPIIAGGTLSMTSGTLNGLVSFAGSGGVLIVDGTNTSGAVISGFLAGDAIDNNGMKYSASATATVISKGVVAVSDSGQVFDYNIAGATTLAQGFVVSADPDGDLSLTTVFTSNITVSSGVTSQGISRTNGETLSVLSGGVASATYVADFGQETVSAGGIAIGTHLGSTGFATIAGGTASGAVVSSGGLLEIISGGSAYQTVVQNGGDTFVTNGSMTSLTVLNGGHALIGAGAAAKNVYISGGQLTLAGGGTLSGAVTFGKAGQFIIDAPTTPNVTISNFTSGDRISLAQLYYSGKDSVSVETAGVVTISAGGTAYKLNIAGAAVGAEDFSISEGNYGLVLTTTQSPTSMSFLRPTGPRTAATSFAAVPTVRSAATPAIANSANFIGPMPALLKTIPHGGLQIALVALKTMLG